MVIQWSRTLHESPVNFSFHTIPVEVSSRAAMMANDKERSFSFDEAFPQHHRN
ncbi:hypothetical protein BDD14_1156 [Edaphobacter modestus]|uniref:Uncharacterized protein n=1 Tax=Edaphobacter modestus TaxID=388466 RepID=A0A4Q7YS61_9BACT|nr:hypothetical protein BDD14_1156 [Edaphobacter modestus]